MNNPYDYETTSTGRSRGKRTTAAPAPAPRVHVWADRYPSKQPPAEPQALQLALLGDDAYLPVREPDYDAGMTIAQRFDAFHAENPHVLDNLKALAMDLRSRGVTRYGIKALYEVLRYNRALATRGDVFKLNNNYTAHYARKLMDEVPELEGFFETRERGQ